MVREQQMRQPSGALFPTDEPIPASQMIGRRADVHELAVALEGGTNVVVAGARRTGKTSVCEAALTEAASHGFYVAAVDLFRLANAADLAEALATQALRNRPAAYKIVAKARAAGRRALSATQAAAAVKLQTQLGDAVEVALAPGLAARDPDAALDAALELPQRIARADGRRFIVFFDEFQEVANARHPYGDPDAVTKRMRAIFQRASEVSFLFAGSLEHVMRDLFGPQERALSAFGTFRTLAPITAEDWRAGLAERFASDGCEITPAALDLLIDRGELHPRVTMLIAQQTHYLSVLLGERRIGTDLVTQGWEQAYHGDSALLDQIVERIRLSHRQGLVVARRVAAGRTLAAGLNRSDVDRALKRLVNAGIIDRLGRGDYVIANPLLRRRILDLVP